VPAKVLAYVLTLAIPIAGFVVTFLVGWCVWRFVLALTRNADFANVSFGLGMVVSGAAFIRWVWVPLRPAIKRRAAKRE
jgi:hypothetical protein